MAVTPHQLAFIFGLLGNVGSFLLFLAPLPTFYIIYKKKSSEGYQSIPYMVTLSSSMLFLYYGVLKSAFLVISVNCIGCVMETSYLIFYLIYASPKDKKFTVRLILLLNVGAIGFVVLVINCLTKGPKRLTAIGWTSVACSVVSFASPLGIVRQVIKTKSVEFMPFSLSLSITFCGTTWFFHGLLVKDIFIATPNMLGLVFGIAQMIIYFIYKGKKNNVETQTKQDEEEGQCKEVSLGSVDPKDDNNNQPADIKEMEVIAADQKPSESNESNIV